MSNYLNIINGTLSPGVALTLNFPRDITYFEVTHLGLTAGIIWARQDGIAAAALANGAAPVLPGQTKRLTRKKASVAGGITSVSLFSTAAIEYSVEF